MREMRLNAISANEELGRIRQIAPDDPVAPIVGILIGGS
jgi:hypothetical protein